MEAPLEYKSLTQFGTSPEIQDGERTLREFGAIVEYIWRKHGGRRLLLGLDHPDYADFLFWFHFANGSMVPAFMVEHITAAAGIPAGPSPTRSERVTGILEARLGEAPYFAGGEFTAADIMLVLPRSAERIDLSALPNMRSYIKRVTARGGWQGTEARR